MNEKISRIRENEKKSHTMIYSNEKLYETDGWLKKPIQAVKNITTLFEEYKKIRVLDLGCGIGRNSIYVCEKFQNIDCIVDCVDILPVAIEKLLEYATERGVLSSINCIIESIEEYHIVNNKYDLIMAVSALEHVDTMQSFLRKLTEIKDGLRKGGVALLIINSEITESDNTTGEILEAQFEINISTSQLQEILNTTFESFDTLKNSEVKQEYVVPRENCHSRLKTTVVTYIVKK